jgi:WD40 repeat protein
MRVTAAVLLAFLAPLPVRADLSSREKVVDLSRLELLSAVDKRYTHCLAPSGAAVAVFDANIIRLVDPRDGRELQALNGHVGMIHDAGWSRDGSLIATSGFDETVRVWETATGRQLLCVKPLPSFACSVAFSPDGRQVAVGSSDDGQLKLVDVASGRVRGVQTPDLTLYALEFTPDGRQLVVNHTLSKPAATTVRVFNVSDWSEVKTAIRGHVTSFALSRDGKQFAYSTPAGTITILETRSWGELRSIEAHATGASSLAFHPRGRFLASSGRDGTMRVWNAESGASVLSLPIKSEVDSRLVFGADEESLVVATADAVLKCFGRRGPATALPRVAGPSPKGGGTAGEK